MREREENNVRQCQMELCFMAHLEPTRLRWENGQVSLASLETREASVQECNGVSSLCTIEHSPSAWAGFAPKLTVTLTVAGTKLCLTPHSGSSSCTQERSPQYNSKPCKCPSLRCSYHWLPCTWHLLGEAEAIHCKCPCAIVRFPEDLFMMFNDNLS